MTKQELISIDTISKLPSIKELIAEIRLPTKIESVKAEDEVIRIFLRTGKIKPIIKTLNAKYAEMNFTSQDVIEFLTEFKLTIKAESNLMKKTAQRRMLKTREGLSQELLDLAILSKRLATKYDEEGDHSSAIQAIKAASDIFFRNAKLEGIMEPDSMITVNMKMDRLVQQVSSQPSDFAQAIKKSFNAEYVEVKDGKNKKKE